MSFEDFARHLAALEGWTLSPEQRAYCRAIDNQFSRTLVISPGRRFGLRWLAQAYEQYRMHETVHEIADVVDRIEFGTTAHNCSRDGHIWEYGKRRCVVCDHEAVDDVQLTLEGTLEGQHEQA